MDFIKTSLLRNKGWVVALTLLYIVINAILFANQWYYLSLLPFVLLIVYFAVFSVDKLIYLVVFFVPISVPLEQYATALGFNQRTSPLSEGC